MWNSITHWQLANSSVANTGQASPKELMSIGGSHGQEVESVSEKVPDHVPQVPLCLQGLLEEPECLVKLKGSGRSHKREPTPAVCSISHFLHVILSARQLVVQVTLSSTHHL